MREILLLEDDRTLSRGITLTLQKAGYGVTSAFTLSEAEAFVNILDNAVKYSDEHSTITVRVQSLVKN